MTLRKTQLKKLQLQEIMQVVDKEIDSDNLKLITNYIAQKNQTLLDKKTQLLEQLESVGTKIKKAVYNLNNRAKDRLEKTEKIIMNKDSRPSEDQTTQTMQIYDYHEQQTEIIDRNCEDILKVTNSALQTQQKLLQHSTRPTNFATIDAKYQQLQSLCRKEEVSRDEMILERNQRRNHYSSILNSIESCRQEYEKVENLIRDREREFTQLTTYLSARQTEQQQILVDLPAQNLEFQHSILQAQQQLTQRAKILQQRLMLAIEESRASPSH